MDIQQQAQEMTKQVTDSSLAVQPEKPDILQPQKPNIAWNSSQSNVDDPNVIKAYENPEKTQGDLGTYGVYQSGGDVKQSKNRAELKDEEGAYKYVGGGAPLGASVSGATVSRADNNVLLRKYEKVKPYEIPYKDGTATVDSLNKMKALHQARLFYGDAGDVATKIFGYDYLPDIEREGFASGVVRGLYNLIPSSIGGIAGFVGTSAANITEGIGYILDDQDLIDYGNDIHRDVISEVDAFTSSITADYSRSGLGQNVSGQATGNLLGSMAISLLGGPGGLIALSAAEGMGNAYEANKELFARGVDGFTALGLSGLAGIGTAAIGASTAIVGKTAHAALKPAGGWVAAMKNNPSLFFKQLAKENFVTSTYDALGEAGQDLFTEMIGKGEIDDSDLDQAATTIVTGFLVGNIIGGYKTYMGRQTEQQRIDQVAAIAQKLRPAWEKVSAMKGSPYTMEMFDAMVERFKQGDTAEDVTAFIKDHVVQNIDRVLGPDVTEDQKKILTDVITRTSTDGALLRTMDETDKYVDQMLDTVSGDGTLTQGQKDMFRIIMRGIAVNQMVHRGLSPQDWMGDAVLYLKANANISASGQGGAQIGNISTVTEDGKVGRRITVATDNAVNAPQQVAVDAINTEKQTSNVSQIAAQATAESIRSGNANVDTTGTIGAGAMRHEMGHFMTMFSGLENVPEFVQAMKDWADSVLPGARVNATKKAGAKNAKLAENEVVARAFEFASDLLKPLGLEGKTADYMNLLLSIAQANTYVKGFKEFVTEVSNLAKQNDGIISEVLDSFSQEDAMAFKEFCKTGKNEVLDPKTLDAIYNALNSYMTEEGAQKFAEKIGDFDASGFLRNYRNLLGEYTTYYGMAAGEDALIAQESYKNIASMKDVASSAESQKDVLKTQGELIDNKVAEIRNEQRETSEESAKKTEEVETEPVVETEQVATEPVVPIAEEIKTEQAAKTLDNIEGEISDFEKRLNEISENNLQEDFDRLTRYYENYGLEGPMSKYHSSQIQDLKNKLEESIKKRQDQWGIRRRQDKNTVEGQERPRIVAIAEGISDKAKELEKEIYKTYGEDVGERILNGVAHAILLDQKQTLEDAVDVFTTSCDGEVKSAKTSLRSVIDKGGDPVVISAARNALSVLNRVDNEQYFTGSAEGTMSALLEGASEDFVMGGGDQVLPDGRVARADSDYPRLIEALKQGINSNIAALKGLDTLLLPADVNNSIKNILSGLQEIRRIYNRTQADYITSKAERRAETEDYIRELTDAGDRIVSSEREYIEDLRDRFVLLNNIGVVNGWKDSNVIKRDQGTKTSKLSGDEVVDYDNEVVSNYSMDKEQWLAAVATLDKDIKDYKTKRQELAPGRETENYANKFMFKKIRESLLSGGPSSVSFWPELQEYAQGITRYRASLRYKNASEEERLPIEEYEQKIYDVFKKDIYISTSETGKLIPLYNDSGEINPDSLRAAVDYLRSIGAGEVTPANLFALTVSGIQKSTATALENDRKRPDGSASNSKYVNSVRLYVAERDIRDLFETTNKDYLDVLYEIKDKVMSSISSDAKWVARQPHQKTNVLALDTQDLMNSGVKYDRVMNANLFRATVDSRTGRILSNGTVFGDRIALVDSKHLRSGIVLSHHIQFGEYGIEDEHIVALFKGRDGKVTSGQYSISDLDYMLASKMPVYLGEPMNINEAIALVKEGMAQDPYVKNLVQGLRIENGVETSGSMFYNPEVVFDPFEGKKNETLEDVIDDLSWLMKPSAEHPGYFSATLNGESVLVPSNIAANIASIYDKSAEETKKQMVDNGILAQMLQHAVESKDVLEEKSGVPLVTEWADSKLGGVATGMSVNEFIDGLLKGLENTKDSKLNKTLFWVTRSVGLGNQFRNLAGTDFARKLGLDNMSNKSQNDANSFKRALQKDLTENIFGGDLSKMLVWLQKASVDIQGTEITLPDGSKRPITKQELMTLYLAYDLKEEYKRREKDIQENPYYIDEKGKKRSRKLVDTVAESMGGAKGLWSKLTDTIPESEILELFDKHLDQTDKDAVTKVFKPQLGIASKSQGLYVPVTTMEAIMRGSWDMRNTNGYMVFGQNITDQATVVFPVGIYEALMKTATHNSLQGSNFISALNTIKTLFDLGAKYSFYPSNEFGQAMTRESAIRTSIEKDFANQFKLLSQKTSTGDQFTGEMYEQNIEKLTDIIKKMNQIRNLMERQIGSHNFEAFMKALERDAGITDSRDLALSPAAQVVDKLTRSVMSSVLFGKIKSAVFNSGGNYAIFAGLSESGSLKYMTSDFLNAITHSKEAFQLGMKTGFIKARLENAGLSDQYERLSDMQQNSIFTDLTNFVEAHKGLGAAEFMRQFDVWSKKMTAKGVGWFTSFPDVMGICWAYYAVKDNIMKKAESEVAASGLYKDLPEAQYNSIVEQTADGIFEHYMLTHISNSNYMTRGLMQKQLAKLGLASVVAFTNDQLLKGAQIANAIKELMNTSDPARRKELQKEIIGCVHSSVIYVMVQAGVLGAMLQAAFGELDDKEKEELWSSLARESVGQVVGMFQFGNIFQDILDNSLFGSGAGFSVLPGDQIAGAIKSAVKMEPVGFVGNTGSLIGLPWLKRVTDIVSSGYQLIGKEDFSEEGMNVFGSVLFGRSENTAMRKNNLRKDKKSGKYVKVKPKKKKDKEDE